MSSTRQQRPVNPLLRVNNSGRGPALQVSGPGEPFGSFVAITKTDTSIGDALSVGTATASGSAIAAQCTRTPPDDCFAITAFGRTAIWARGLDQAGLFDGNVNVRGTLTKTAGSFKIDHPLDSANKYLSHSFVESPDMMNIYNGVVVLDGKGEAWVALPDWFEELNRDFRYQLTAIGAPAPKLYVAKEISGNRFKIAGGKQGGKVSWQVTGVRQDAYANAHRVIVEEDKPAEQRGYYLYPEVFGQPATKSVGTLRRPEPGRAVRSEGPPSIAQER